MKTVTLLLAVVSAALVTGCSSSSYRSNDAVSLVYGPDREVDISQVSPAAQRTIGRQMGPEPIAKIERQTQFGQVVYLVELRRDRWYHQPVELLVGSDGAFLGDTRGGPIETVGAEPGPRLANAW